MSTKLDFQSESPLEGRWLVVSIDDESWERIRNGHDFFVDFETPGRFRVVTRPKSEKTKTLLGEQEFELSQESYRIEDGLFVQKFGGLHVVSKYSFPKEDELEFERIRISGCFDFDGEELPGGRMVLRRLHE